MQSRCEVALLLTVNCKLGRLVPQHSELVSETAQTYWCVCMAGLLASMLTNVT